MLGQPTPGSANPTNRFTDNSLTTTTATATNNPFNGLLSRSTRVSRYQKKHSLTHTQSFCMTSVQVFFGPLLGFTPSNSKSMHFSPNHSHPFLKHVHTLHQFSKQIDVHIQHDTVMYKAGDKIQSHAIISLYCNKYCVQL